MSETDLQLGGGYTYQWECAILLALNWFFEPVAYNRTLFDLITDFMGEVLEIHLEGEDRESGLDLEDINLVNGDQRILIQVKTKQAEGERWTPTDTLLLKALHRFYSSRFLAERSDDTRFVFLTNRPFNPALVKVKSAIREGGVDTSAEVNVLCQNLDRYAEREKGTRVAESRFCEMIARTALVEYLAVDEVKANVQAKLQAYGRPDWEQAHAVLFEHFARQSTQVGGGIVTRASVEEILGGSPRFPSQPVIAIKPYEPETAYVPAGEFLMGAQGPGVPDYEGPPHRLRLPAYNIGKFPVTNAQYAEYVRGAGASISPKAGWELARVGQTPPEAKLNHPVVGVSWDEAVAYCRWLSQDTGRVYRLPTEAEWEKAARGAEDRRVYPWGDEAPDADRCNFGGEVGDTTPVGGYSPLGDSPYGVADMAGNVWEWTSTMWGRDRAEPDFVYPYPSPEGPDGRDDPPAAHAPHREYRLCRGGSFRDDPARLRCSARARFAADTRHARLGFRVVLEL